MLIFYAGIVADALLTSGKRMQTTETFQKMPVFYVRLFKLLCLHPENECKQQSNFKICRISMSGCSKHLTCIRKMNANDRAISKDDDFLCPDFIGGQLIKYEAANNS